MKYNRNNAVKGYLLVSPLLLGCLVFYAVPFCMMLCYSVKSSAGRSATFVGLENYREMLQNEMFLLACRNTLKFLMIGLPLILILSYVIALMLKKYVGRYKVLKSVLMFPYIMPIVGTVFLVEMLFAENGSVNRFLALAGGGHEKWLETSWALGVAVILYLWKNIGYSIILLLSGLITISENQYLSAEIDGAGSFQKFRYITTPQMWHSVFFALLFSMINTFKCFREIFLIGGKHPNPDIYMLQHFINNSFENFNYNKLSVASVLMFAVITIVVGIFYSWIRRREV